jgi:hypothetical protein
MWPTPYLLPAFVEVPLFDESMRTTIQGARAGEKDHPEEFAQQDQSGKPAQKSEHLRFLRPVTSLFSQHNKHHHMDLSHSPHKMHMAWYPYSHTATAAQAKPHNASNHWPHVTVPAFMAPHHPSHPFVTTSSSDIPWSPRTDIRETDNAYIIEIEVPGLRDGQENELLVQWMSPRTLVISGDAKRRALATPSNSSNESTGGFIDVAKDDSQEKRDGGPLKRTASRNEQPPLATVPPTPFLVAERHVGYWRRSFTLPKDADFDIDPNTSVGGRELKVQIDAGIVEIRVPRKKGSGDA